jgi:hypothetical protein
MIAQFLWAVSQAQVQAKFVHRVGPTAIAFGHHLAATNDGPPH